MINHRDYCVLFVFIAHAFFLFLYSVLQTVGYNTVHTHQAQQYCTKKYLYIFFTLIMDYFISYLHLLFPHRTVDIDTWPLWCFTTRHCTALYCPMIWCSVLYSGYVHIGICACLSCPTSHIDRSSDGSIHVFCITVTVYHIRSSDRASYERCWNVQPPSRLWYDAWID